MKSNIEKLEEFKRLEEGWDGYNGKPISDNIIERTKSILEKISPRFSVYPTSDGYINIYNEENDINYQEIEVKEDCYCIFTLKNNIENDITVYIEDDVVKVINK